MMQHKEYYQKTFARLHASDTSIQEVLHMEKKKGYCRIRKSAAVGLAATMVLCVTGGAYAATNNLAAVWDKIVITLDGQPIDKEDCTVYDENGNPTLVFNDAGDEVALGITLDPEATEEFSKNPDGSLALELPSYKNDMENLPFTPQAENDRLYLVEKATGEKIDITEEAASPDGFRITYTDADSTEKQAVILGTPQEYAISFPVESNETNVIIADDAVGK